VRLRVPADCTALANARCVETSTLSDGRTEVTFAETPPLATYLVAVAVGPFDVVEADPVAGQPPLRVVTTRGRGHLSGYALSVTPRILAELTRWFDLPYPYDKLDLVGVPNFAAGAMENVGLVTFRERLLLLDAAAAPATDRLWAQVVIAHELAHMWFGNLVTMRWWDDLWLNEAFATWMEMACIAAVDPPLDADLEAVAEGLRVMDHDALSEARAIRQPIVDGGDVLNAFDGITYGKGAAVVRMTEAWLGARVFGDGVRQYLVRHAHGNADTADLLNALTQVSGQPVASTLVTFLDQPGLPLIEAHLETGAGGPALRLRQRRWLPSGAPAPGGPEARWHLPVTVRVGDDAGAFGLVSTLLTTREAVVPVPASAVPPDRAITWVHPNADEAGYYRWTLAPEAFGALLREGWPHLKPVERLGLPEHLWALAEGGRLPIDTALEALTQVARDPHRMVLTGVCATLRRFARLVPPASREAFADWVGALLGPHLERVGVLPRADDDPAARLLRPVLVTALADAGAASEAIDSPDGGGRPAARRLCARRSGGPAVRPAHRRLVRRREPERAPARSRRTRADPRTPRRRAHRAGQFLGAGGRCGGLGVFFHGPPARAGLLRADARGDPAGRDATRPLAVRRRTLHSHRGEDRRRGGRAPAGLVRRGRRRRRPRPRRALFRRPRSAANRAPSAIFGRRSRTSTDAFVCVRGRRPPSRPGSQPARAGWPDENHTNFRHLFPVTGPIGDATGRPH
jgi:hypothetical protein